MKKKAVMAVLLAASLSFAAPVMGDIRSDISKAEGVLGIDHSSETTIKRIEALEKELGISTSAGETIEERIKAIDKQIGIADSDVTSSSTASLAESVAESSNRSTWDRPSDDVVVKLLSSIDNITSAKAVTETTDLNHLLNKEGGYIGCVYFHDKRVTSVSDDPLIAGTDGGGAVEIFPSQEDANQRDEYLLAYNSPSLTGSHKVVGTCVVRISGKLSSSEQAEMTDEIEKLLPLDESQSSDSTGSDTSSDAAVASEVQTTNEATTSAQTTSQTSTQSSGTAVGTGISMAGASELELYNQDGFKITCLGFTKDADMGMTDVLKIRVQNLTQHNVDIYSDNVNVNGQSMFMAALSLNVSSGKTATGDCYFMKSELKNAGIENITDITLNISAVNQDDDYMSQLFSTGPISLSIDKDGNVVNRQVYRDAATIQEVQTLLNAAGYDCGTPDGVAGKKTNSMILQYEKDHNLTENTDITDELLQALRSNS